VSLIIPTKNRSSDLEHTLESVFGQKILPTQLIIVDQGQGDETRKSMEKLFADARFRVREKIQLCYISNTKISGLTVARNRAMEVAQGDIWLFLDDDVVLEANFLEELLSVYQRYPQVTGVSGIISNYLRPSLPYRLWAFAFARGPFQDERQAVYWQADRLRVSEPIAVTKLGGGLMSFRGDAIRGRCFDENLCGVSDGEDVDFCARLGPDALLVIAPRARLVHKKSPIGRAQEHWLRRFARANYYLYHRNWERGFRNGLAFVWLNMGLGLVAALASIRRVSSSPWLAFVEGARDGTRVGRLGLGPHDKAPRATTDRARFGWRL
jgi:GT2 family glycosyltransferase